MLKVKNKKIIKKLTLENFKANRGRNRITVLAIVLTTVLFSSIFSAVASLNRSFQQESFRQVGGEFHVGIKDGTPELIEEIKDDPMIQRYGTKLFLGNLSEPPFHKAHIEMVYMDETEAKGCFCEPETGRLPQSGKEVATDTRVLKLMGIEQPQEGMSVTFSYTLDDGSTKEDTFTLTGWWQYDDATIASMVIVPQDYCETALKDCVVSEESMTGKWSMDISFSNSWNLSGKLDKLLANHGYQRNDEAADNYLSCGVNWAYTSTGLMENFDVATMVMLVALVLLVFFAGYLIIYNIFRIAVGTDIRFYGMLKTIGTTEKQITQMVNIQAERLMLIGIPIGLVLGYGVGNALVPIIMGNLHAEDSGYQISFSAVFMLVAALFSMFTVAVSCRKPARIAAKVSPMEALRYTEVSGVRGKRKGSHTSLFAMARANVGRSRSKMITVTISLTLSVVLLVFTVAFVNGFDMDKFTGKFTSSDFAIAPASYFNHEGTQDENAWDAMEDVAAFQALQGVTECGMIYHNNDSSFAHLPVEKITELMQLANPDEPEYVEGYVNRIKEKQTPDENGCYEHFVDLYGMDALAMEKLVTVEGDVSKAMDPSGKYIIQVAQSDDYEKPIEGTAPCQVGDTLTITYGEEYRYLDVRTGEEVTLSTPEAYWEKVKGERHSNTYTVCAVVTIPYGISYRQFGSTEYILAADIYKQHAGNEDAMLYMLNVEDSKQGAVKEFLTQYTERVNPNLNFESKEQYQENFSSLKQMFIMIGGTLSIIIGLIGILNFFNAMFTSIYARRRELAVMESVGMTESQVKKMLIYEGLIYTGLSIVVTFFISGVCQTFILEGVAKVFWLITPQFTIWPLAIILPLYALLGSVIPLVICKKMQKSSVVERLHVVE